MSSLLRPIVLDSCQTTLRERRRSSIHPLNAIPRLLTPVEPSGADESAVLDDPDVAEPIFRASGSHVISPPCLSPLSDAHLSEYSTSVAVPRHRNSVSILYPSKTPSPTSTFSQNGLTSRKTSCTDLREDATNHSPTLERLKWRLASGFFAYFMCGWGDGVTGTVLPYFVAEFHLNTMTSSLLFAGSTCGYALGTVLVEPVMNILGRFCLGETSSSLLPFSPWISRIFSTKKAHSDVGYSASQARHVAITLSSISHAFHFIMMGSKSGFPVMFLAYALAAFSRAFLSASLNAYFASGPKQSLGYAFGLWSFGGVVSPMLCQALIASGVPWSHFYFGSLVLSAINTTALFYTFRPTSREFSREHQEASAEVSRRLSENAPSTQLPSPVSDDESHPPSAARLDVTPRVNIMRLVLSMPYQWAFSFFALLYCGSETVTQGFMVTYLLATRNANPKTVGYVTSGFWGGITVGRFVWGYFAPSLSFTRRKHVVFVCLVIALAMQLLIWFVNSNVENAFSTAVIGVLYGPIFPACLSMANDILPTEVHLISMTLISASASLGSSLFPFIVGTIARVKGIHILTYLTVPLVAAMLCLWSLFPSRVPSRSYSD